MKPVLIAGPCVIEPTEIMDKITESLVAITSFGRFDMYFKESFDKANRTAYKSYRGPGIEA